MKNRSRISKTLKGNIDRDPSHSKNEVHSFFRSKLTLPKQLPEELELKVADTCSELEAAMSLVYKSYVDEGLMKKREHELRMTKYHAVPTTAVIVAKLGNKVVGTMTIVQDSPLSLPIDDLFDVSSIRSSQTHLAEISSLAIDKQYRGRNEILFTLFKFCLHYCFIYTGVDCMVITVNPGHQNFYEALYFFEPIHQAISANYKLVEGAPAVGLMLNRDTHFEKMCRTYHNQPKHNNMFHFVWEQDSPQLHLPIRPCFKRFDSTISENTINFYLKSKNKMLQELSPQERAAVYEMYRPVLDQKNQTRAKADSFYSTRRTEYRFPVYINGYLKADGHELIVPVLLKEAAYSGCMVTTEQCVDIQTASTVNITANVFPIFRTCVTGEIKWSKGQRTFGIRLSQGTEGIWNYFITKLNDSITSNAKDNSQYKLKKTS